MAKIYFQKSATDLEIENQNHKKQGYAKDLGQILLSFYHLKGNIFSSGHGMTSSNQFIPNCHQDKITCQKHLVEKYSVWV